ncbi:MAG: hypothetical protein ACTHLB_14555 [Parafilimonas sp.]
MSTDLITIPRSDWRALKEAIQSISINSQVADLVNREQACEILGIDSKTFTNKKIKPDSVNGYGQKFYSRAKLLGLKK